MYKDVKRWVESCPDCQRVKVPRTMPKGKMVSIPISYPWERMGVDIMGPLPKTDKGNQYIVVFIDYFTKWPEAFALPDIKAETVARVFVEEVVCRYGAPVALLSDQGKQFKSTLLKEINSYLHIHKQFTTAYHPQTDGLVERMNSTLQHMLKAYTDSGQKDWDLWLPYVLFAYRTSAHESTKESPFYLMFARDSHAPVDVTLGVTSVLEKTPTKPYAREMVQRMKEAHELAKESLMEAQKKQKKYYDEKHQDKGFEVGQKVLLQQFHVGVGKSKKLVRPYKGPYTITNKNGLNYDIVSCSNPKDVQKVHVLRLKDWVEWKEHKDDNANRDSEIIDESNSYGEEENDDIHEEKTPGGVDLEVEEILDTHRVGKNTQYLLRWKGFGPSEDQWVFAKDMHAPDLVRKFWRSKKGQK